MTQGFKSGYQQMLADTAPRNYADEIARLFTGGKSYEPKTIISKNVDPSIINNIKTTGKGIAKAGKVSAKYAGKAAPLAGAGITGYDAFRSFQIADNMDKINAMQPGTFRQEEIDFYRNKGRAIASGMTAGGIGGGVLGAGVFSAPGAVLGTGIGGTLGDIGYSFAQRNNPYANAWDRVTPEQIQLLQEYNAQKKGNSNLMPVSPTGVPTGQLDGGLEVLDTNSLTGGIEIPRAGSRSTVTPQQANKLAQQVVTAQQQTEPQAQNQQANINAINNYIAQLQQINQPYINALTNYYNNYGNMLDQRQRAARFWQGAASLTGNPAWANIGNQYDAITNEANRVAALKQIQDTKAANANAIYEALGNMAAAQDIGLSPEAAFANKNLLSAISSDRKLANDLQKAQLMANTRLYGYDTAFDRAMLQQIYRNIGAENVAKIYAGMYGGGVAPGLNAQGTIPMMYNNTQVPVQQPQSLEASVYSQIKR